MTQARPFPWLRAFQYLAGLCDSSTGLLLIFAPTWTLTLMGVHRLPQPIEFASFVGVFVLGVGLAYFSGTVFPLDALHAARWRTVWLLTGLIRTLVAIFLMTEILAGQMEHAWITVAITDGAFAAFQWIGLGKGWLNIAA